MGEARAAASQIGGDPRTLVEDIAKALVDHPEQVSVTRVDDSGETVLELRVAPDCIGKVIGRQGRTVRAIRTILGAVSTKLHHRYSLEVME